MKIRINTPVSKEDWREVHGNVLAFAAWIERRTNGRVRRKTIFVDIWPNTDKDIPENLRHSYGGMDPRKSLKSQVEGGKRPQGKAKKLAVPEILANGVYKFGLRANIWSVDDPEVDLDTIRLMLCNGFAYAPERIRDSLLRWHKTFHPNFPTLEPRPSSREIRNASREKQEHVLTYDTQDTWYSAVADAIEKLQPQSMLRHAHIQPDPPPLAKRSDAVVRFIDAFEKKIEDSRVDGIEVRQFYSVSSLRRAKELKERIDGYSRAYGYQAKLWPTAAVFPLLSPVIVGDQDAFLAPHDPSSPQVQRGLHIHGRIAVANIIRYFDSFFLEQNPGGNPWFRVRKENGPDPIEYEAFHKRLKELAIE